MTSLIETTCSISPPLPQPSITQVGTMAKRPCVSTLVIIQLPAFLSTEQVEGSSINRESYMLYKALKNLTWLGGTGSLPRYMSRKTRSRK
jgi:hypothetical protein